MLKVEREKKMYIHISFFFPGKHYCVMNVYSAPIFQQGTKSTWKGGMWGKNEVGELTA